MIGTAAGVDKLRPCFSHLVDDVCNFQDIALRRWQLMNRWWKKAQFNLRCSIGALTNFFFVWLGLILLRVSTNCVHFQLPCRRRVHFSDIALRR